MFLKSEPARQQLRRSSVAGPFGVRFLTPKSGHRTDTERRVSEHHAATEERNSKKTLQNICSGQKLYLPLQPQTCAMGSVSFGGGRADILLGVY